MPVSTDKFKTVIHAPLVVYGKRFTREEITEFLVEFLMVSAPRIHIYRVETYWDSQDGCALFIESDTEIPNDIFGVGGYVTISNALV